MGSAEADPDPVRDGLERALGAQYSILRLLGRGGMGAVYLARDVALERLVAVKVLPLEKGADTASRERFRREARTAARLTHPNIVPLHGFGEVEGMLYLVMGYVQGQPLSARMRAGATLGVDEVRRLGADIAEALDHAHGREVVHRDVKPDNILIDDETGRAMLADFGVAKARGAGPTMTQAGGVVGTPAYMSPEQAAGHEEVDGRSDLYSLGVVLYALLAGRPPFIGADAAEVLVKHLTQEPAPIAQTRAGVPEDLAAAVMRCLAKDRDARWSDARRLREALAPTGLDEEQLPEPLDGLDGLAPKLLPVALVFPLSVWHLRVASTTAQEASLLGVLAAGVLGGVLVYRLPWVTSAAMVARRRGFAWPTILGALLRQPAGWPFFWYPRRLRRRWDVWDRLPLPFRVFRGGLTLALVAVFAAAFPLMLLIARVDQARAAQADIPELPAALVPLFGAALLCVVTALVGLAFGPRHVLPLGYDVYTRRVVASALMSGPTSRRSVWKKPEVARALLAAEAASPEGLSEPRLPRDYVSAIARAGGPAAEAEAVVREIAGLDSEIEGLAADADAEETARQAQRLADLGPERAEEGEERRQRRRLLQEQLALAARVEERLRALRERRDERLQALRALWRGAVSGTTGATETATRTAVRS